MTQIAFFLAEHTEELLVLWCCLIMILLFVTLHRMKQITNLIQEIAGNTKDIKDARQGNGLWEGKEKEDIMLVKEAESKQETIAELPIKEEDEKLLSEVLGEVFF